MQIGVLVADRDHEAARARGGDPEALLRGLRRLERTAQAVTAALAAFGHAVKELPVNHRLLERLVETPPALVFNTYFGPARRLDQAHAASILELAGVPFTGGDAACHFLGLSKPNSKRIFSAAALPTPRGFLVLHTDETERLRAASGLRFPLIAKAPAEGEGIGIDAGSVVHDDRELGEAVQRILDRFAPPALVEEFLPGREFTVGVIDGKPPRVLPILEIVLGTEKAHSFHVKANDTAAEVCPARVTAPEAELMGGLAVRAGRALGCRDYWRVDIRQDHLGAPHLLEVNTLPGLQPGYSDFPKMAGPAGLEYGQVIAAILESAARRFGGSPPAGDGTPRARL